MYMTLYIIDYYITMHFQTLFRILFFVYENVLVVLFCVFGIYETVIWECWTVVSRRVPIV